MKPSLIATTLLGSTLLCGNLLPAQANWTLELAVTNNYLFNGVSQTDKKPAFQPGLVWEAGNGFYAGFWGSNVDFGEGTKVEFDGYLGYYHQFKDFGLDVGLSQYTYHGRSYSSDLNFREVHVILNRNPYELSLWYSNDYFGFGGGHLVVKIARSFALSPGWTLQAGLDRSHSFDKDSYDWEGKSGFFHAELVLSTELAGFVLSAGLHTTTLKERWGDDALVLSVSRSF
ncbi:TorF family putative porin [Alkalimonas sp. MEB108]|uniref:TorF family putative porin n=1 Tax=Alkalimonas cellulosilytica TaxID=3058395 RepID=A0ABU7J1T5_9GAMM|nr:TorF family putative porin [Alkalimonas sp. MEB108]MEE2000476.1 TorF family putative porin [Alkalimonas sp. MEB108]